MDRFADDLTTRRLVDLASRSAIRGGEVFTRFLDPAQQMMAVRASREAKVSLTMYGGYEDAERRVGVFHCGQADALADAFDWPIECVRADWRVGFGDPEHRDMLGAVMSLAQDRSRFGDIVICRGYALLFCLREMANYVASGLVSAGRTTLRCSICGDAAAAMAGKFDQPCERRDTIPSFRLDACVASAFDLSRAQAQALINEGKVRLNHLPVEKCDAEVGEGGLISMRGRGRALLKAKTGMNRKGRFCVLWECTFS